MQIERHLEIERAARRVNPSPSDGQKEAGNYSKGHVKLHGMDISIETARGQKRAGIGSDGLPWESVSPHHYGYIRRTEGADGDQLDVYVGPHHKSQKVYVVDQKDADSGDFDEHKAFLGFANRRHAESAYRKSFSDDKADQRMGGIKEFSVDEFKDWARNGDTKAPLTMKRGGRVHMAEGGTVDFFARNQPFIKKGSTDFNTGLGDKEPEFRSWLTQNNVPFDPEARVSDYDMRGFWRALQNGDDRAKTAVNQNDGQLHFPDYWKTPHHQTFSNESQWAAPNAPRWNDKDQLVNFDGAVLFDERAPGSKGAGQLTGWASGSYDANDIAAARIRSSVKREPKMASGGTVNAFDEFDAPAAPAAAPSANAFDEFDAAPAAPAKPSGYFATNAQMNREAREQFSHGIDQVKDAVKYAWNNPRGPEDENAQHAVELAKGVGNTALGGLGYVTSPLNAALRTYLGQPVEDLTGIKKEATEIAAGVLLPGLGARSVASAASVPTKAREIADAAERLNVSIPRAAATESVPIQSTAGALKEVPVVGAPLVDASKRALKGLDNAVERTVAGYGSGEPLTAGQVAAEGLENWITGKSGDIANRIYKPVEALVDPAFTRPLHATEKAVADIMAKRANAKIAGTSKAVDEVLGGIQSGGMNYQGLKDLRTYIGEMTPQEMAAKGISKTETKRIYGALSEDLRGTVLDAGGPDALKAFDRATSLYEKIADKRADLAKVIGLKADAAPERVMDRIMAMAGSKGGADYSKLVQVRRAIGPEKWDEVTSAVVNRMGRDKPGAAFSGDRFKTSWDALPDNSKRLMFNSTGKTDLAKSVEDIMTLSDAHKQLMKFGNPSGTGRVATLTGMAGALWAAPLPTIASAVGGNVLARVLASPVAAKQAAKWSLVYNNAAKYPSPGRMMVLGAASENLAKAINRDIGGNFSGSDFLKGLQGPVPGRADEAEQ